MRRGPYGEGPPLDSLESFRPREMSLNAALKGGLDTLKINQLKEIVKN